MITIAIIFTIFYLKYLRRLIIAYRMKKKFGENIGNWLNYNATPIEMGTLVTSMILAIILVTFLIKLAITYLP